MISFNNVPANVRVPLFYAEVDNSQAGYFSQELRTLIIGQKLYLAYSDSSSTSPAANQYMCF